MAGAQPREAAAADSPLPFPLIDLHVHLDNSTIDAVLALATQHGIQLGIVEHAGTKENQYPVVLSNDEELGAYLAMLEGKPVYKGVQAEWIDWAGCFSPEALARLDYVLGDAMTFPGPGGQRVKLWENTLDLGHPQTFMDRYVDWYVQILSEQPLDIFANVAWLPAPIAGEYDSLWTDARMAAVIDTAVTRGIAIEISSGMNLPKRPFLQLAKDAGAKFTFGSNGRYPNIGKLDYSIRMARELELTTADMFVPKSREPQRAQRT
jgi:histidinol phosphatase-like PHP family hydrolase